MSSHVYQKYCDAGRLEKEIKASVIPKAVDYITTRVQPAQTTVVFKEALSEQNILDLTVIVTAHIATPLPEFQTVPVKVESFAAYGAKTISMPDGSTRKLFGRNTGLRYKAVIGNNVFDYTLPYPWCKILGVEAVNCEIGDYADFLVYDTPLGTYSRVPNLLLNQFAYTINLPNGHYERVSRFDADMYQGMKIRIAYYSISEKTVGFNLIMDEVKA